MGMPRLVRTSTPQLFGDCRVIEGDDVRGLVKEALHHRPQAGTGDAGCAALLQAGDQGHLGIPTGWRHGQAALRELLIERHAQKRR